jgi:hypothetical protein
MSREEWSKISAHPLCAYSACFAVFTLPGGALCRRFLATDFPDFTDFNGRKKAPAAAKLWRGRQKAQNVLRLWDFRSFWRLFT